MKIGPASFTKGGTVQFGQYGNGETSIQIVADDGSGEMEATATVNVEPYGAHLAGPKHVWLKSWSENEGIPEALQEAGICELMEEIFCIGQSLAILAKLSEAALSEIAELDKRPIYTSPVTGNTYKAINR